MTTIMFRMKGREEKRMILMEVITIALKGRWWWQCGLGRVGGG
jgi:hypothetical protein